MSSTWIFQANPAAYDIDGALQSLTEVSWRVPQYTGAIAPGDGVVLWRSGAQAGVIGVGRVIGLPADGVPSHEDNAFSLAATEGDRTTRVPILVKPTPFQPKTNVAALNGWRDHQIVTAPMGTVFPISELQWHSLAPLLTELPVFSASAIDAFPPAFAWEQRRKDVYPMPGGYTGYLTSLRRVLEYVGTIQPERDGLVAWVVDNLGVTETSSRLSMGFLLRIGIVIDRSGNLELGDIAARWLIDGDHAPLIALLHSRIRFIGEFLAETAEPKSDTEILEVANVRYDAGWQTKAQIRRRRGWLESAGFLLETNDGKLATTATGRALIAQLDLRSPIEGQRTTPAIEPRLEVVAEPKPQVQVIEVSSLIDRLHAAANDGTDPDRFEKEATEAFRQLGFRATWLGGSGKTDVLLQADLGRDASYRVVVDCKSTGRGSVSQQIDWDTIDEHRELHRADHAAILAPGFGGGRLPGRAERHGAVLLTVDDLAELLGQHSRVPLGLDTYRLLFTSGTMEDGMAAIGEAAVEAERRLALVQAVLNLLEQHGPRMGALTARDFALLLGTQDELPDATEPEIADIILPLASSLLGGLASAGGEAVRLSGTRATAAAMLRVLADRIDPSLDEEATYGP